MMRRLYRVRFGSWYQIILLFLITFVAWQGVLWFYLIITSEQLFVLDQIEPELITQIALNPRVDSWRELDSTDGRLFVFSAYLDERRVVGLVRIIAAAATRRRKQLYCHFDSGEDDAPTKVLANYSPIREHWNLKYSAFFMDCAIPKSMNSTKPISVTLSENDRVSDTVLRVHSNYRYAKSERGSFAVCVKPFHYNYDRAVWLVEFVEMHRILGVRHFYFYNHSVGPNVDRVLKTYENLDIVTVLPWTLDVKSQKEIRTEGMFAALNDCLYRTMYLYKYSIMIDLDEFIFPRKNATYAQMMKQYENNNLAGSFVFCNAFFYLYWENDTSIATSLQNVLPKRVNVPFLVTLFKTKRQRYPHSHGVRSKYIVKPEAVIQVGNHAVWKHIADKQSVLVPKTTGLSHHYRICEFGGFDCVNTSSIIDRATWTHAFKLMTNVLNVCEITFPETGQCPEAPPLGSPW